MSGKVARFFLRERLYILSPSTDSNSPSALQQSANLFVYGQSLEWVTDASIQSIQVMQVQAEAVQLRNLKQAPRRRMHGNSRSELTVCFHDLVHTPAQSKRLMRLSLIVPVRQILHYSYC